MGMMRDTIVKVIKDTAMSELNDKQTRDAVLLELKKRVPMCTYVCDETNNSPEVIDNRDLVVDVEGPDGNIFTISLIAELAR